MKPVQGHPEYVREPKAGAILLKDTTEIDKYRLIKKNKKELISRIETLEKEMKEMKDLITSLVNRGNNKCH